MTSSPAAPPNRRQPDGRVHPAISSMRSRPGTRPVATFVTDVDGMRVLDQRNVGLATDPPGVDEQLVSEQVDDGRWSCSKKSVTDGVPSALRSGGRSSSRRSKNDAVTRTLAAGHSLSRRSAPRRAPVSTTRWRNSPGSSSRLVTMRCPSRSACGTARDRLGRTVGCRDAGSDHRPLDDQLGVHPPCLRSRRSRPSRLSTGRGPHAVLRRTLRVRLDLASVSCV
jgi:hypothetical protein